jgi:hypothetical protein
MRNRPKPSQVTQASFEPARIAVTQRVCGCYCEPARHGRLWRGAKAIRQTKGAERRDKVSVRAGKREAEARPQSFQNVGGATNGAADS